MARSYIIYGFIIINDLHDATKTIGGSWKVVHCVSAQSLLTVIAYSV